MMPDMAYRIGDWVKKRRGGSWRGKVVGWYQTSLTPEGYCIESAFEPGSVQIYPATALEPWCAVESAFEPKSVHLFPVTALEPWRRDESPS